MLAIEWEEGEGEEEEDGKFYWFLDWCTRQSWAESMKKCLFLVIIRILRVFCFIASMCWISMSFIACYFYHPNHISRHFINNFMTFIIEIEKLSVRAISCVAHRFQMPSIWYSIFLVRLLSLRRTNYWNNILLFSFHFQWICRLLYRSGRIS